MIIIPFEYIPPLECISSFAYKTSFTYVTPCAYTSSFVSYLHNGSTNQVLGPSAQKTETQENKSTGDVS